MEESRKEEERLRGKKKTNGVPALRLNQQEAQKQIILQPLEWQRRQEMPPQQVTTGSTLIEGVERTNAVVVKGQRQGQGMGPLRRDPYIMEVDRRRNCYNCGRFRHIA